MSPGEMPSRYRPLASQRVVAAIRADIESGKLQSGDPLPTVDILCDIYDVSRMTVLKALRQLREAGLIQTIPRYGSSVI